MTNVAQALLLPSSESLLFGGWAGCCASGSEKDLAGSIWERKAL